MRRLREIAIVGGGLAGLSLAVALVRRGTQARITVIDPRTTYSDDRTWCFWDVLDHPFRDAISHRWDTWRVTSARGAVTTVSQRYPYCRLPAGAFYERAFAVLEAAENVTLLLGCRVASVSDDGDTATIDTDNGAVHADIAFDARPPVASDWVAGDHPFLWQSFEGWRVTTQEPIWNTGIVDLMDFSDRPSAEGIGFLYTLPLAANEALVESTAFVTPGQPSGDHGGHIERALVERFGGAPYQVSAREAGRIPMTTAPPPQRCSARVVPIGTRAGAPRPSSGYAFLPIQRHSQRLARQVTAERFPDAPVRSATTRWLDAVFLRRLLRQPDQAPELFRQLFQKVSADRLARFLTETGSPADHLAVMAALPWTEFATEALIGPWRPLPTQS